MKTQMKTKVMTMCAVAALLAIGTAAQAQDFVLWNDEHLDVSTSYSNGHLFDSSTADVLEGGYIQKAYTYDEATLNISRGSSTHLYTYNNSNLIVSGGSMGNLLAYDTSNVTINDGSVSMALDTYNSSNLTISGGTISGSQLLNAYDESNVTVTGGTISIGIRFFDTSSVSVEGGNISSLSTYQTSTVAISGGGVSSLNAFNSSRLVISGGSIASLYANDSSSITLYGDDFRATGNLSLVDDEVMGIGLLACKWSDGTSCVINIANNDTTATILVSTTPPEPYCGDVDHPYPLMDFDEDCRVDLVDFAMFAAHWLECTAPECD